MDFGLLILRLVVGGTIAAHGAQKLWGTFGGPGPEGFATVLGKMGFNPPRTYAYLAGGAEFGGGVLIALGLFTPFGAAAVAGMMLGATLLVHIQNGFFNGNKGFEFPLVLGTAALTFAFTGPGEVSFDHALGLDMSGLAWGAFATVLAAIAPLVVLASRNDRADESATEKVPTPTA